MNFRKTILLIFGIGSGISANIVFIITSLLAVGNDAVIVKFPFKEWIVEIPLAIIGTICMIILTKEMIECQS